MGEDKQKKIFSKNLNSYIASTGKTQLEIAKSIGVSPQTFNTWCKGIAIPRMGKVQALADYFHINKSDLIEAPSPPSASATLYNVHCNTEDECNLIISYRKLNDENKRKCSSYTNALLFNQELEEELMPNAAHESSAPYTDEERQEDENMLD